MPPRFRHLLPIAALVLGACDQAAVQWSNAAPLSTATAAAPGLVLRLPREGAPSLEQPAPPPRGPRLAAPCPGSMVIAAARPHEWFAAWWSLRMDGTDALYASQTRDDGAQWSEPRIVDDRDRSVSGCQRPPPAIATEPAKGYVQLVYSLDAGNGQGLWLTHAMAFGDMWHPPVGILFGEHASRVSVAAAGDTVAVAYEDPTEPGRVSLALSFTAGHVFTVHTPASGVGVVASDPRIALTTPRVAVAWRAGLTEDAPDSAKVWTERVGEIR